MYWGLCLVVEIPRSQIKLLCKWLAFLELVGGGARTIIGIIMMIVVGIIIIGGIKRIASVTEKIVPFMAGIYVLACLYIIFSNLSFVDDAFAMIINQTFAPSVRLLEDL